MRLFLAAAIPENVVSELDALYDGLKRDYHEFNWVPQKNYHVTIAFLGERSEDKMPYIIEAIERSTFDIQPTRLFALETGMFVHQGIILRLAFSRNKDFEKIRERTVDLFSMEKENDLKKKYIPHMTLARYKLPSKQQYFHLRKKLQRLNTTIEFPVTEIHLYKSITKPTNPEYEIVHTFELVE
ncbi:RNA 2',3'-cyclic phosphodiesterase [Candidatus Roizmanbacteria bacterium]|nr:MAG: RNA 2',3'-cyclic phosphodiesterase [Candidatus Roizmanbacteria bacterium]